MGEPATCPERVYGGAWEPARTCAKPVKRNGKCGIHAAADEKRARNQAERDAKDDRDRARRAESKALAVALTERLGIVVINQWSSSDLVIRDDTARAFLGWPATGTTGRASDG